MGFLYGAGALVGGIAGADLGIVGSGIVGMFTFLGVEHKNEVKYGKHLNECNFLVFVRGSQSDIEAAEKVLKTYNLHLELDAG